MNNILAKLQGWKTYIVALIAVLTALVGYLNNQIDLPTFISAIFLAVQTANIRHGVTTTVTNAMKPKV